MLGQLGFTLKELVMVIVILGILSAVAIPKYVDLSGSATTSTKEGMGGAVRSALAVAISDRASRKLSPVYPSVTQLASYIQGSGLTAGTTGIAFTLNGTSYIAQTYTDPTCATPTSALTDQVQCVGDVTP